MSGILDEIVAVKREEVKRLRTLRGSLHGRTSPWRPFAEALKVAAGHAVIAEIKKASPSKGVIAHGFDPVAIAKHYKNGNATALSVLTDEKFFMGSIKYLEDARAAVDLPVLRKDFMIDEIQIMQAASINSDAILLIAAILSDSQMQELFCAAGEMSLDSLIEVHTPYECERVLKLAPVPALIGINNRNLQTFVTDISVTLDIIKMIPDDILVISESGISSREQAEMLFKAGVGGLLVGEYLMRADDSEQLISCLQLKK
jgi:indole-3-glycerol phosphate synthase